MLLAWEASKRKRLKKGYKYVANGSMNGFDDHSNLKVAKLCIIGVVLTDYFRCH